MEHQAKKNELELCEARSLLCNLATLSALHILPTNDPLRLRLKHQLEEHQKHRLEDLQYRCQQLAQQELDSRHQISRIKDLRGSPSAEVCKEYQQRIVATQKCKNLHDDFTKWDLYQSLVSADSLSYYKDQKYRHFFDRKYSDY